MSWSGDLCPIWQMTAVAWVDMLLKDSHLLNNFVGAYNPVQATLIRLNKEKAREGERRERDGSMKKKGLYTPI